jgi:hypothetical protein
MSASAPKAKARPTSTDSASYAPSPSDWATPSTEILATIKAKAALVALDVIASIRLSPFAHLNDHLYERSFIFRTILVIGRLIYRFAAFPALMLPISQDVLRGLMAKGNAAHPELLALLQKLTPAATADFVTPHYHLYSIYETRLDIAQSLTGEWYEGLKEAVEAMAASPLANIRFLQVECLEGDCSLFVEEELKEILGIIYFPHKLAEDKPH